jgi:hypothetical protein
LQEGKLESGKESPKVPFPLFDFSAFPLHNCQPPLTRMAKYVIITPSAKLIFCPEGQFFVDLQQI